MFKFQTDPFPRLAEDSIHSIEKNVLEGVKFTNRHFRLREKIKEALTKMLRPSPLSKSKALIATTYFALIPLTLSSASLQGKRDCRGSDFHSRTIDWLRHQILSLPNPINVCQSPLLGLFHHDQERSSQVFHTELFATMTTSSGKSVSSSHFPGLRFCLLLIERLAKASIEQTRFP